MHSFIIRSVGERTTQLLKSQLENYYPGSEIVVINETPFTKALETTYDIASKMANPWITVFDGDIILEKRGFDKLFNRTLTIPPETFEIQGLVLDKLFLEFRPAGVHVYNRSLVLKGKELIPQKEDSLRPESFVMRRMQEIGHPFIQTNIITGLHDFEQYYKDIFRTGFVHGKKHKRYEEQLVKLWMSNLDIDYKVAHIGFNYGKSDEKINFVTNEIDESSLKAFMKDNQIEEKTPLNLISEQAVIKIIEKNLNFIDKISYKLTKSKLLK